MKLTLTSILTTHFLVCASMAFAEPELRVSVWPTYGVAGSPRSPDIVPGETLYISADISGPTVDERGGVEIEIQVNLANSKGGIITALPSRTISSAIPLGGQTIRQFTYLQMPRELSPGKYTVRVSIRDKTSRRSTSADLVVAVLDRKFSVVNLQLTRDRQHLVHSGGCFFCGETVFIHFSVASYRIDSGNVKIKNKLTILDSTKKEVGVKPVLYVHAAEGIDPNSDDPIPIVFELPSNRPGSFIVRIEVEDLLGKAQVEKLIPIEVYGATSGPK